MLALLLAAFLSGGWAGEPAAQGGTLEARVTVRVKNASLASLLDSLSAQSKVNFILAEGLEDRKVTLFLRDVTARDVLEALRLSQGLTYWPVGSGGGYRFVVGRRRDEEKRKTKVYHPAHITTGP